MVKINQPTNFKQQGSSRSGGSSLPDCYRPSRAEAEGYFRVWGSLPNYVAHEKALATLFRNDCSPFRANTDLSPVIIKVSALNDFYSTNIYRVYDVACKIVSIPDFDSRLQQGDLTLVRDFQTIEFTDSKGKRKSIINYSFATKYCSHHQPDKFPIYDSYVDHVLRSLRRIYPEMFKFRNDDLRDYEKYTANLDILRREFGLESLSYKELDRYLWQLGKRYFARYADAVNGAIDYKKFNL